MIRRLALLAAVIVAGLSLRFLGHDLGVPGLIVKYGGSLLWATMVYLLVGQLAPRRERRAVVAVAMTVAICVEMFRLYHTPWLDAFRLTLPGKLLLGRIFSLWDLAAYAAGVALGAIIHPADHIGRGKAR